MLKLLRHNRGEDERRNHVVVFVRVHGDVLERLLGVWPCRLTHTLTADLAIKHTIALMVKAWPSNAVSVALTAQEPIVQQRSTNMFILNI